MLHRGIFVVALAAIMALIALPAEAGSRKLVVSPVFVPPDQIVLVPIRSPLAGAFLVSQPPHCAHRNSSTCRTTYYFQGRWSDRPDIFYIIRHK
jgi:hypothetical protein